MIILTALLENLLIRIEILIFFWIDSKKILIGIFHCVLTIVRVIIFPENKDVMEQNFSGIPDKFIDSGKER